MLIKRIKAKNYKTYQYLDLDLSVEDERPIILIGGKNGGGKTTLFSAIYGALYGLKIPNAAKFKELVNASPKNKETKIELELVFTGRVLGQEQTYIIKRIYMLNNQNKPVESVTLNMNGSIFVYGTATPPSERIAAETQVNKILKANLPEELSKYFLFDAMEAGRLLEEDQLTHVIKQNIENVMGFNKYIQLAKVSAKLQQQAATERLDLEKERKEYTELCNKRDDLKKQKEELEDALQAKLQYSVANKKTYETLKAGKDESETVQLKIKQLEGAINNTIKKTEKYRELTTQTIETLEHQVWIPMLIDKINAELTLVLQSKAKSDINNPNALDYELVKNIVHKVVQSLDLTDVDEQALVYAVINDKEDNEVQDEYAFLDVKEVNAIKEVIKNKLFNNLPQIRQQKKELDVEIEGIPSSQQTIASLMDKATGGNYKLITDYEENEKSISETRSKISELNQQITALSNQINGIDIQIQQEPDPRFDTLVKLNPFFNKVADTLLKKKKSQIEAKMCDYLNSNLAAYEGVIGKVQLSESLENLSFQIFHKEGNEIYLSQLNAGAKQVVIQVLLKVLHELGDYDPPVMIDTVMGVLDKDSRDTIMENYFPSLADQTILLSTDTEIRTDNEYKKLKPFIAKAYTIVRDANEQRTDVIERKYFEVDFVDD